MPARRTKFTRRQVRVALVAAVLLLVGITVFDWLVLSPWAVPFGGRQTLTGRWAGTASYGSGVRHTATLDLGYDMNRHKCGNKTSCTSIRGELRECGPSGTKVTEVSGKPNNRSGSSFWLILGHGADRPAGDYLHDIDEGAWQGDRITLRTRYSTVNADGTSAQRSEAQSQVRIDLHRVTETEYDRACAT